MKYLPNYFHKYETLSSTLTKVFIISACSAKSFSLFRNANAFLSVFIIPMYILYIMRTQRTEYALTIYRRCHR